jgi:hypothetical protein
VASISTRNSGAASAEITSRVEAQATVPSFLTRMSRDAAMSSLRVRHVVVLTREEGAAVGARVL